ncbi:hypothetical protein KY331_01110 [Candidatus Woesearchaeota archaeon]|nr:hypothetical protein [Candidatus Woesearchaeota archaeon]
MGFNLEDYEPVEERIKKFYEKYPEGRIITEPLNVDRISQEAFFRAEIWNGNIMLSTGYAHEISGSGYVNKTSHVENCETSAIGRALANMGLHGNKRPSREEMEKSNRMSNKQLIKTKCKSCKKEAEVNDKGLCLDCQINIGKQECIKLIGKVYVDKPSQEYAIKEVNNMQDISLVTEKYKELYELSKAGAF